MRGFHLLPFCGYALAGSKLWDGRFNELESAEDLNKWSFSNKVGPYQYYIHGSSNVSSYVALSPDFKNPADVGSVQGVRLTLDSTSYWNNQTFRRTELIPQANAPINASKVFYHFSIKRPDGMNAPNALQEHQIAFFESHFTELKYGFLGGNHEEEDEFLQWMIGGKSQWKVKLAPDVWHNVAYEIDFDKRTVAFWHSEGANELVLTMGPVPAETYSDNADFHLGILRIPLPQGDSNAAEDWFFSGVYVETEPITRSVDSGPNLLLGGLSN